MCCSVAESKFSADAWYAERPKHHPLDEYREKLADMATHDTTTTEGLERGVEVAMRGVITGTQRRRNKEQKLWASFVLEDWAGTAECMAFAKVFEDLQKDIVEDKAVLIRGSGLPEENTAPRISVKSIVPLEVASLDLPRLLGRSSASKDKRM